MADEDSEAQVAGDETSTEGPGTGTADVAADENGTSPRPPIPAELVARAEAELGDDVIEATQNFSDYVVRVKPEAWRRAAQVAKEHLDCDYLSYVAGIDWAPTPREGDEGAPSAPVQPQEMTFGVTGSAGRFQVFARTESTRRHWGVTFKTDVDEQAPSIQSWVSVYPGADWHERECWEMYGFSFSDHPSLRHLYLPSEFEGHPLRKDFPLLSREVKPWPGLVDVEDLPEEPDGDAGGDE